MTGWHRAGWGFRIAGTVLPLASLAVRRSPLARSAKNGQFWPVFGLFWPVFGLFLCAAATVVSGAKCQPSQHPGTPRVVTNGRRAPATTPFNEPFVAHTCMYSCLAACFLLVLGHFACKYVSSNKLQRCKAIAHRTEQNSPKTAQNSSVFACRGR